MIWNFRNKPLTPQSQFFYLYFLNFKMVSINFQIPCVFPVFCQTFHIPCVFSVWKNFSLVSLYSLWSGNPDLGLNKVNVIYTFIHWYKFVPLWVCLSKQFLNKASIKTNNIDHLHGSRCSKFMVNLLILSGLLFHRNLYRILFSSLRKESDLG